MPARLFYRDPPPSIGALPLPLKAEHAGAHGNAVKITIHPTVLAFSVHTFFSKCPPNSKNSRRGLLADLAIDERRVYSAEVT